MVGIPSPGQELEEYIYKLTDPFTFEVRWIGRTTDPPGRLMQHLYQKTDNSEKGAWVADLRAQGAAPIMEIIEKVIEGHPIEREKYWIKYYLKRGAKLLNRVHNRKSLTIIGYEDKQQQRKQRQGRYFECPTSIFHLPEDITALDRWILLTLINLCKGEEKPYELTLRKIASTARIAHSLLSKKPEGPLDRLQRYGIISFEVKAKSAIITVHMGRLYGEEVEDEEA